MSDTTQSVDIQAPVKAVYDQWVRFEEYPEFMEDVLQVEKINPDLLRWRTTIAGVDSEWEARITEDVPNSRVVWQTNSSPESEIVATFDAPSDNVTRLTVSMQIQPEKVIENIADMLGVTRSLLEANLMRFKTFIETKRAHNR